MTMTRPPQTGDLPSRDQTAPSFDAFFARMKAEPVYVILGVQGSGTNLLRSILVRAFNFSIVQDQSLVYNAAARLGPAPTAAMVQRQLGAIRSMLFPSPLMRKVGRRIKSNASFAGFENQLAHANVTRASDLALLVYAWAAFSRGTTLMAIKSDDLWQTLDRIDTVLPNRRIILLTRDFRDNLLSITKKDFGPVEPVVAARYVKERFAHYDAEYRRTAPASRFHVRYEDLLESPDAFVEQIGAHFGLAAAGALPGPVDTGRIRRNNKRKWAVLSPGELAQCEAILRGELQTYGYGTECDPVDPPEGWPWLTARARDSVRRVPQKLRTLARRAGR